MWAVLQGTSATVYLQFDTKPAILKALVDEAIMGADHGVPTVRSPWFLEVLAQPTLDRKVELLATGTSALHERTGPLFAVAREAAAVDPQVKTLWSRGKRRHLTDNDDHRRQLRRTRPDPSPPGHRLGH
jgi:hypothetical protein